MGVYQIKQLIIIRKDLGMNKGKLAAQASHASMAAVFSVAQRNEDTLVIDYNKHTHCG
jgi:peptidyl-tRNA hydrolase, PTH2 family